ncbi:hypothetical protein NPIL_703801 [Nephila pilipes]|uniref:Uncharacterized protein n=1 Tax=Nephila pilipes TaxID=299642 RepID=A0A8X6R0K1_NEPPI|nr:hypothetical protein NPIL_703801 [Nephila pilipes]
MYKGKNADYKPSPVIHPWTLMERGGTFFTLLSPYQATYVTFITFIQRLPKAGMWANRETLLHSLKNSIQFHFFPKISTIALNLNRIPQPIPLNTQIGTIHPSPPTLNKEHSCNRRESSTNPIEIPEPTCPIHSVEEGRFSKWCYTTPTHVPQKLGIYPPTPITRSLREEAAPLFAHGARIPRWARLAWRQSCLWTGTLSGGPLVAPDTEMKQFTWRLELRIN